MYPRGIWRKRSPANSHLPPEGDLPISAPLGLHLAPHPYHQRSLQLFSKSPSLIPPGSSQPWQDPVLSCLLAHGRWVGRDVSHPLVSSGTYPGQVGLLRHTRPSPGCVKRPGGGLLHRRGPWEEAGAEGKQQVGRRGGSGDATCLLRLSSQVARRGLRSGQASRRHRLLSPPDPREIRGSSASAVRPCSWLFLRGRLPGPSGHKAG